MDKVVKIGEKEYKMKSSAWTLFSYKNEWKKDLLKDFKSIYALFSNIDITDKENIKQELKEDKLLDVMDMSSDMIETLTQLAYTMIKEADKNQVESYESFLKGIDNLFSKSSDWINEVVELGISLF